MKSTLIAFGLVVAAPFVAQAECYSMFTTEPDRAAVLIEGFSLVEAADEPGLMTRPDLAEGADALLCYREEIVPAPNDFELVRFHNIPLMIYLRSEGRTPALLVMAYLDEAEGPDGQTAPPQYFVQLASGEISDGESSAIDAMMRSLPDRESELSTYLSEQRAQSE